MKALHVFAVKNSLLLIITLLFYSCTDNKKIFEYIKDGKIQGVEKCINENHQILNSKSSLGDTPLILAVKKGNIQIIKLLLNKGANPNEKDDENNWTPLYWAINNIYINNNYEIVEILIKKKSSLKIKDKFGYTPLHWAAKKNEFRICKLLINQRKININSKTKTGFTPLMLSVVDDDEEAVKITSLLIANGAEVDLQDDKGRTALIYAVINNSLPNIKILLNSKANVNIADEQSKTAIDYAESRKVKKLIHVYK